MAARLPAGILRGDRGRAPIRVKARKKAKAKRPASRPPQTPVYQPKAAPTASIVNTTPMAMSGGMGSYDIGSDPAVAAARGLSAKIRAQAAASAFAKRKQAAIEYGDADELKDVEGFKADKKGKGGAYGDTDKAAESNPYSIIKQMEKGYGQGVEDLEEGLNEANLYYSGYRQKQLGEAADAYGLNKYNAANSYRSLLTDISDQLADKLLQADMIDAQAAMGSDGGSYGYSEGDGGDSSVQYALAAGRGIFGRPSSGTVYGKSSAPKTPRARPRVGPALSSGFNHGRPVRGGY